MSNVKGGQEAAWLICAIQESLKICGSDNLSPIHGACEIRSPVIHGGARAGRRESHRHEVVFDKRWGTGPPFSVSGLPFTVFLPADFSSLCRILRPIERRVLAPHEIFAEFSSF